MIPHYKEIHNKFHLNGISYNREGLKEVAYSFVKEGKSFEQSIGNFLLDWLDTKEYILAKTSGSTGRPKTIVLKKQAMVHSAIATGDCFKLKPGDKALHCLSTDFIAGKMMLVRALILGLQLDIVEPSSKPYINNRKHYDFCAMVPMQVENCLDKLKQIRTLIIGGASTSNSLIDKLQKEKTKVFATYGMTETITHIAVKQLNKHTVISSGVEESYFKILPNITISQDKRDCLVIEASNLFDGKIVTNDIVNLHSDTEFEFLGRYDNVINSGGVKLFPEQIEDKLSKLITERFFITSETDDTLGEKVVLVLEAEDNTLPKSIFEVLDAYEKPKLVRCLPKFSETASGKVDRRKTYDLLRD